MKEQAFLLKIFSMEECEVLCSSIAIMVNGCFRCLGSTQHLKNRFGDGYTVKVRLRASTEFSIAQSILDCFEKKFVLKEKHLNILQYEIAEEFVSLKEIFAKLEKLLNDELITDYSVTQNTLDNVFVNFVRDQCDTLQQPTNNAQSNLQFQCQDEVLDDTFGDGSFVTSRSKKDVDHVSSEKASTKSACDCRLKTNTLEVLDCSKL